MLKRVRRLVRTWGVETLLKRVRRLVRGGQLTGCWKLRRGIQSWMYPWLRRFTPCLRPSWQPETVVPVKTYLRVRFPPSRLLLLVVVAACCCWLLLLFVVCLYSLLFFSFSCLHAFFLRFFFFFFVIFLSIFFPFSLLFRSSLQPFYRFLFLSVLSVCPLFFS